VIVSSAGGAAELIEDGVDALAFPPGDDVALAERLERLALDPVLRARIGAAARSTALRRFDPERLGAQIAAVHDAVRRQRVAGAAK
jgi:colanic acid/amylovoran biosynthesis glycosyltransferase